MGPYLNEKEPCNVEPEYSGEVDGHGQDGEEAFIKDKLVHQATVDVQHHEKTKLKTGGNKLKM